MTREDMIAKLCVREEGMYLSGKTPTRFVTVGGPTEKYTDDELALLAEFTDIRQATYELRYTNANHDWSDNYICFDKEMYDGRTRWGRKRYSWREGRMHASSLPEAIAAFWSDRYRDEMIGDFCLLRNGDIVQITGRIPFDLANREYDFFSRRLVDGAEVGLKQYDIGQVVIYATSIEALGDRMRMAMAHRIENQINGESLEAEIDTANAAMTDTNDPAALSAMWKARVRDWHEREAMKLVA